MSAFSMRTCFCAHVDFFMITQLRNYVAGTALGTQLVQAVIGSAGLRIIGMGFGFLVSVQLARGMGPAGYGVYGLAMSVIAIMMVPTEFGLPQLVTREVASAQCSGDTQLLQRVLWWSTRFILLTALVLCMAAVVIFALDIYSVSTPLKDALCWGLLLLPVVAMSNIFSAALRGLHHIIEGQIAELLIRPAVFSLMLFLVTLSFGNASLSPSLSIFLNIVAAAFGAIFVVVRLWPFLKSSLPRTATLRAPENWLASALPLALGEGMRILSGHLAILVLGFLTTESEVGMYRVAFGVYVVATLPSALLNSVCSPKLAALNQEGRRDAIQRLNTWMTLFLLVAALLCFLPFAISGESILSIVFGKVYATSNSILLVLLFGEIISSMLGHPTILLNMLRYERAVTRFSSLSLVINFAICVALVPMYGGIGAALGVATSQIIWRAISSWYAWRKLSLHTSVLAFGLKHETGGLI